MPISNDAIAARRTFAIISHPDAGKTTLTEKLLLFGGAIQLAGAVKARGETRRAHSDWMKVERERGISVASSVMTYEYDGCLFNLLDTPGHEDFSEDTYRTLTAVDSAVMVIDAAKGIENQTRKDWPHQHARRLNRIEQAPNCSIGVSPKVVRLEGQWKDYAATICGRIHHQNGQHQRHALGLTQTHHGQRHHSHSNGQQVSLVHHIP